jgi:hypothetical protein
MRPVVVDGPALDKLAAALRRAVSRCAETSAVLAPALAAVSVAESGAGGGGGPAAEALRELFLAQGERQRAVARLSALAGLVTTMASVWSAADRRVSASWAAAGGSVQPVQPPLLLQPPVRERFGPGPLLPPSAPGVPAATDPSVPARVPASSNDLVDLLAELPPGQLERLLVAVPPLARAVVAAEGGSWSGDRVGADGPADAAGTARGFGPAAVAGETRLAPSPGGTAATAGDTVLADAARLEAAVARAALWAPDPAARAVAAVLATVPSGRRRLLALLRPRLLSTVAAASPDDRAAACRVLVAADLDRLQGRLAATPPGWASAQLRQDVVQRRELLNGTVLLRRPDGSVSRRPHRVLAFDPRGDGQIVEIVGDLRRARHLAVLVPGTGGDLHRYPGYLERVRRFAAADPSLAVVMWQGADFPDQPFDDGVLPLRVHVVAAAYRDAADLAGPALAAEVAGLRVALPVPARDLTVLGHSYGGSIVGSAEAHGMVVDRVVHVGSAGAYVDDARRYAAPPGRTRRFSLTTYDDPIRLAQGHDLGDAASRVRAMTPRPLAPVAPLLGAVVAEVATVLAGDPSQVGHGADPDLLRGVVRLDPGVHDDGRPVRGHSSMFSADSTAWRNLLATLDGGRVQVLEPARWASHLEPASLRDLPHYVVDRTPWSDPGYRPPVLDLGARPPVFHLGGGP